MSQTKSSLAALTLGAIGVVYGDIGTSVLYAVKEVFGVTAKDLNSELAQVIHRETLLARNNFTLENFCRDNPKDPDC